MDNSEFWECTIVASGVEHIRVIRDKTILYDGVMPAPFKMHLTMGDSVLYKIGKGRWIKKFKIVTFWGKPYMKFGRAYGPTPNQYRRITPRRLNHAGLRGHSRIRKS